MDTRAILVVVDAMGAKKGLDEIDTCGCLKDDIVQFGNLAFLGSSYSGTRSLGRQQLRIQKSNIDKVANSRGYDKNGKQQSRQHSMRDIPAVAALFCNKLVRSKERGAGIEGTGVRLI